MQHGEGTYNYFDGSSYKGNWTFGKRKGAGTFTSNGELYTG